MQNASTAVCSRLLSDNFCSIYWALCGSLRSLVIFGFNVVLLLFLSLVMLLYGLLFVCLLVFLI